MDFVLNLDTENGRIFILVKKKIIIKRKKIIREIYDPEHAGFKATEIVQNSLKSTPVPPDRSRSEQFLMISSRVLYFFKYSV